MKKLFILSIIFFFALALAGFTPVKADSVVVNGSYTDTNTLSQADYDELQNTALLLKYLQNGGVIDVSNVSDGYSVSDLVSDFGDFVKEVVPDLIDVINPFQSKFEYTPLGNAMLNNNMYKFMGMLPFYALNGSEEPDNPDIPSDYAIFINIINGTSGDGLDFFWRDMSYIPSSNVNSLPTNQRDYSYVLAQLYLKQNTSDNYKIVRSQYNADYSFFYSTPISLYFNTDENNQVILSFTCNTDIPQNRTPNDAYYYIASANSSNITNSQAYMFSSYTYNNTYKITNYTKTFQDLASAFSYATQIVRNVNIYVDGEPWSIVHQTQTYNLQIYNDTVSPVATNDYGYVHWVYDYEIFFRIDRIWDILQDILDNMGNGGTTIIKWPDIDDVIVDVDGQPAVAVKIYTPDSNIDEEYWSKYGPLVPVFIPLATPVINDSDILLIAKTPMSALPDDLLDVFGYIFIGSLFVCFIHRLLE